MTDSKHMNTEELRHILALVNEGLRFGESKNAALLTLSLGVIFIGSTNGADESCWPLLALRYIFTVSMLLSTAICLLSFFPKLSESSLLKRKSGKPQPCNVLYFGSIAPLSIEEYTRHIKGILNNGEGLTPLEKAYVDQIKANSVIAALKFRLFTLAISMTALGLLALAILLLVTL